MNISRVAPTLPAQDIDRAKRFYSEKLGIEPARGEPSGGFWYEANGYRFLLFHSTGKPSGNHTQMGIDVPDVEAAVRELQSRGVQFQEVDTPELKTVNGVATVDGEKAAWFSDSEGNLIALAEGVA